MRTRVDIYLANLTVLSMGTINYLHLRSLPTGDLLNPSFCEICTSQGENKPYESLNTSSALTFPFLFNATKYASLDA